MWKSFESSIYDITLSIYCLSHYGWKNLWHNFACSHFFYIKKYPIFTGCVELFFFSITNLQTRARIFDIKTTIAPLMPNDHKMTNTNHHIVTLFCSRLISKACLASLSLPSLICFLNSLWSSSTCCRSAGETFLESWIKRQMSDWTECEEHNSHTTQTSPFHEERCTLLPAHVSLLDPRPVPPADDIRLSDRPSPAAIRSETAAPCWW